MKKLQLLITFLLLISAVTFAQQKKYISYEVKQNENLKSIAKDYNLSTKDLARLNPGVSRKPVMGTIIIVPNKNYGKATTTVIGADKKVEISENATYIVQPKETLYGISKKFGVSMEALQAANPQLSEGVKIGMQLTIPKPAAVSDDDTENYELHTVVKDDTVYNLTKRYGVSEADLYALNPQLKEGLKLGMVLKMKLLEDTDAENIEFDEVVMFEENLQFKKEINVAILLPYQINSLVDTLMDQNFAKNNLLNISIDFHMGSKMAIDSLKRKGLKVNVSYFDSENSDQKLLSLLNSNQNFNKQDFIIGPMYFDKAQWIANKTKTPVLAPIYSKKQEGVNQQNLIKSAPNNIVFQEKLLANLEQNYKGEDVLIVNDGKAETQTQLWQIVNRIKTFDSIQSVSVIKPKDGYIDRALFLEKIDTIATNWVLIVSDDNVTTSATINGLKGIPEETEITLFALNKGKNFDTVDNSFLGKMNFTFPTNEFIDTENVAINYFYNAYFDKNKAYPSKYALRGFDTTYDAIVRLASAESLEEGLGAGRSIRMAGIFNYSKNAFGSIENNGLFLIKYHPDLTFTIIE